MAVITRMSWNGACSIDRQGPAGSWRIQMANADRVHIVEGMTTTDLTEFARQINREIREARKDRKRCGD